MSSSNRKPIPNDATLGPFAWALDFVQSNALLRLPFHVVGLAFFTISPRVPYTFGTTMHNRHTRSGFWWGCGLTFFFCFVVPIIWSCFDGTYVGTDKSRVYFSQDLTDLINFGVLCPMYVGFSMQLFILLVRTWGRLASPANLILEKAPRLPFASIGVSVTLILSVSAAGTVNYIRECLNPSIWPKILWWIEKVDADGTRTLSPLGIYYTLLIFALLSICVTAILAFLSLFSLCVRFGKIVAEQPIESTITFDIIRDLLSDFTQAYIVLKLLAVVLVVNIYTWNLQILNGSINFIVLNAVLFFFGVFLISAPRYYIEVEWFRFRVLRSRARNSTDTLEIDDVRPFPARLVARVADSLVLSGFCLSILIMVSQSLWKSFSHQ